jgi:hypothetical protein
LKDFFVNKQDELIIFTNKGKGFYPFVEIYLNGKYAGAFAIKQELAIRTPKYEQITSISISGYVNHSGALSPVLKHFQLESVDHTRNPSTDYRAGDILVACDNVDGMPYGYMGHSALVVDEKNIIESVISDPIVRKVPISQFTDHHPMYAHFRPKKMELGQKATSYAESYLEKFEENKKNGINRPIFYFSVNSPITDEWTYIYCSKFIWLSYHYGAGYSMPIDHLWFSPEDLYTILSQSNEFELLYKHPNYQFFLDL